MVRLRALQPRRRAGAQRPARRCRPVPHRRRLDDRHHSGAPGAQGPRQSRARLRVPAGESAGARPVGAGAGAPQRALLEQGAARHRLGGRGARRLPGGAHAVDGAAQPRPAGCGGAGVLPRHPLRLRQAQRQRAIRRVLRERRQFVRCRERAHRRRHCAHPQRRHAPARADERAGRALWLVLAAEEPPRCARVPLPVRGAGRTRLPGGTEELPRPAVPERRARTLGREHGRLRGHDRDARARLRRAAAACGRAAHLGRRAEAAAAQHRPRERTARHRGRGRHVGARPRRRARAVGARQARGGRSRRRAGDARVRRPPRAAGAGEGRAAVRPQRRLQGAALAGAPRAERPQPRAARGAEPLDPRGARSPQRTDQHRRVRRARHLAQAAHRRPADASRRGRAQAGRVPRARRGPPARGAERPAGDLPGAGALCARHHVRPRRERGRPARAGSDVAGRRDAARARGDAGTRGVTCDRAATRPRAATRTRGGTGAQGPGAAAMSTLLPRAAALGLLGALLAPAPQSAWSQSASGSSSQSTIGDLSRRKVTVHRDTAPSANASKAMENYRHFLELQNTDPKLRAEALRRLGDLNLDAGEMERLEKEVTAVDLQGAEAIKLYSTLLKAYPDYPRNDQVLYQLARAYETTGQPAQALGTLDRIVQRYPQSPQLDEVQFRRGELLFSDKRYADAERAYAAVIGRGAGSAFFQQSLYKRGWSLFKQSMALESLPSFGGVLDQELGTGRGKSVRLETLKRADRELVEDTLRVMSITFSYNDGAASLEQYMSQHGERPYAWLLYSRLGDLYVDKQRYQDAASVYRAYVARDPYSDHAPDLDMAAIEAYGKGGFSQLVFDGKHEFVEHYNFDSPYWTPRSRADSPRVVQELKTNLKDVATYFHASAQKSKRVADYQEAARWYRDYLKSFPEDADSAATDYLLAEALFESHQYADAAAEYEHTAYGYPRNEKSATAAYAALVSYQKGEEGLSGADKDAWHKRAMDAGVRFAQSFPEHPDSAGVLTRAAEEIFAAGDQPRRSP